MLRTVSSSLVFLTFFLFISACASLQSNEPEEIPFFAHPEAEITGSYRLLSIHGMSLPFYVTPSPYLACPDGGVLEVSSLGEAELTLSRDGEAHFQGDVFVRCRLSNGMRTSKIISQNSKGTYTFTSPVLIIILPGMEDPLRFEFNAGSGRLFTPDEGIIYQKQIAPGWTRHFKRAKSFVLGFF